MLRGLLNSLLVSFPTYLTELTERFQDQQKRYGSYEQKNGWCWNEKELEKLLFRLLIKGTKDQPVVIFVDALDECGEEHAKSILGFFKRLMEIAEREGSSVKICFSSRHFPILGHEIMLRVYVEEKNDKDIRVVVEGQLREIQPDERRHRIENEILLKAHGGFQWAILITKMILNEDAIAARTEDLLSMISSIPPDLDKLYSIILNGGTEDKHEQMIKLFQWVLFAERPLSAQELREALCTDKDMVCTTVSQLRSHEDWSESVSRFETRVRYISRGLVEFQDRDIYEQYEHGGEEWNREAQFIHQSAADFIAQKFFTHATGEPMPGSSVGSGHYEISRSFLKYLTLEEVLEGGDLPRARLSATFPLMPYGVSSLLGHIRAAEAEGIPQNDLIELIQWDQPKRLKMLATIWRIMDPGSTHAPRGWPFLGATVLHIAAAFGSLSLMEAFLQKDTSDLTLRDSEGNTPLHLALRESNEDLALLMLNRSRTWQAEQDDGLSTVSDNGNTERTGYLAYIDATNQDGETPLAFAVSLRADRAIHNLVDAGAEVKHEKSLLFYAISTEDKTLLSKLIQVGANLAGAVYFAIQCMDRSGHCNAILHVLLRDLLGAGADTKRFVGSEIDGYDEADESDDEDFDSDEEAIFLASRHGKTHEISLLLSHGTPATVTDDMGNVALITAIRNRQFEAVKVLLQASPQTVLWKNGVRRSVLGLLFEVVKSGDELLEGIQLLIDGSDGHLTSQEVFNLLVALGDMDVIKIFLQANVDSIQLTKPTEHGSAPIFVAVRRGDRQIVSLLLEDYNIDTSVRDEDGKTTLHIAVAKGDIQMAQLLLLQDTKRVLVSKEDGEGYIPLCRAIIAQDVAMVEILLDPRYVDISQQPVDFQPLLWWTVKHGTLRMAKFLLYKETLNVTQGDENGQTPLWQAIEESYEETTQLRFGTTGINMLVRNKYEQTASWLAVEARKKIAVQRVLESERFDINKEDNKTILKVAFWAMEHEAEHTIRLLLRSSSFSTREEIEQVVRILASWVIERERVYVLLLLFEDEGFNLRTEDEIVMRRLFWLAVRKGNERLVHLIHDSGKFDVNTKDRLGKTPLIHTTESCSEETLRLLLKTGKVDVQATDNEGNTALSIALRKGYTAIADLLSTHIRTTEMVMEPTEGYIAGPRLVKNTECKGHSG
ncbi:Ankyrin protein 3 [Fusarium acuminatum]|uniref:Ankyrin protein 3 n=1 Tax=Fusarium acuminatum TaxID=5515 RepID=A0ABZ2WZB7_9HYPO